MWYKFSKQVFSASAQITKFLSPLPVPEVVESAPSNVQLEVAFCYMVAEDRDSPETLLALRDLAEKLFNLKQRNRITTKVSKQEFAIDSIYDNVVFDDFEAIVEHIDYIMSQEKPKKDMAATQDMAPVISNGKIKIYNPKTYEESERACVGTSWCIGDRSTGMFLKYRYDQASNFYIVEDPNRAYPFRKVAIDVRPNEIEVTDEINDTGALLKANLVVGGKNYGKSIEGYFTYLNDISGGEIKREDFVPRPLTPEEEEIKRKFSKQNKSLSWFMDLSYDDKEAYIMRLHELTFAQFMFMYERKNVFKELLNLVASTQNLSKEIEAVILKDPMLARTKKRNDMLTLVNNGFDESDFDIIVQYKLFTVLDRYVQQYIGNFPKIALSYAEKQPEIKDYLKKFLSEKVFTADFPFDLRFFELFTIDELNNIMPSMSETAKEQFNSITDLDAVIDAFAKQDMDLDLFEKALIGRMDIREAIAKTQETILSKKYLITKPFFLTNEVLTPEFVSECIKNKLIPIEKIAGHDKGDEAYNYGSDIEFDEKFNATGTVLAAMSEDPYDAYDFDTAFDLYAQGLLSGSFKIEDLPNRLKLSSGELGLKGIFDIAINKVDRISEIPVSLLLDLDFLHMLIESTKFTSEFASDANNEQKDAIASITDAYVYANDEKLRVLLSIANEKLNQALRDVRPALFATQAPSPKRRVSLPSDPNARILRNDAMKALGLRAGQQNHELEATDLGITQSITVTQFNRIKDEFERRLMGDSVLDYIDDKYFEFMDSDDDDDEWNY